MRKQFKKALTLLLTLAIMLSTVLVAVPASAATFDGNTDFMSGNYGMFIHYLASKYVDAEVNTEEYSAQWNAAVNSFDVKGFAAQARDLGVSWVTITLTQADGYYPMPMPELNAFMDNGVDYGTERDLVEELYAALEPYGIKLMLYWIPGAPDGNDAVAEKLGAAERYVNEKGELGGYLLNDTTVNNMAAIMSAVSERYGDKVAGWWIDGCYTTSANFTETYANIEAAALRAGNPDALVAFNNGTNDGDCRFAVEDYTAGEICHVWKETTIYDYTATGRWSDNGFQKHYLTFLGGDPEGHITDKGWGVPGTLYDTGTLVNHVVNNMLMPGAALTLDVAVSANGTIDVDQANQISAIKTALNNAKLGGDIRLPITFENGASPYTFVDHIVGYKLIGTSYWDDGSQIELATGSKALNGNYSLKVVPHNAVDVADSATDTRTDILLGNAWKNDIKITGNPDFSKSDFTKATGFMLRMKIDNDTSTEATHRFYINVEQSGASKATFCRGAVVYDLNGKKLSNTGNTNGVNIPKGFDGFIFIPFSGARTDAAYEPGVYEDYSNSPAKLPDLSKEYVATLVLGDAGYGGSTVYFDDIGYYTGTTDEDAWDTMRSLGYGIAYGIEQPTDGYTLPLTFEDYMYPTTSSMAISGGATNYQKFYNLPITLTAYSSEALSGNVSLKISTDTSTLKANNGGDITLLKLNTTEFTVKGIESLSTEKVKAAASDDYAYFKVRIKIPETESGEDLQMYPIIKQNGEYWVPVETPKGYNLDGTLNANVRQKGTETGIYLPSGFDGYVYMPVYRLKYSTFSDYTYAGKGNVYFEGSTYSAPELSEDFTLAFQFIRSTGNDLNKVDIYMDDISVVYPDGDFEEHVDKSFTASGTATGSVVLGDGNALRGDGSYVLNVNSAPFETGYTVMPGNPAYGTEGFVGGIVMRVKVKEAVEGATASHSFQLKFSQAGVTGTTVIRRAYAYDKNGNAMQELTGGWPNFEILAGFDGFLFIPFNPDFYAGWGVIMNNGSAGNANFGEAEGNAPVSSFVDFSKDYKMALRTEDADWAGCSLIIDDINYYTGVYYGANEVVDTEAWAVMRDIGYQILKTENQPTTHTIPLDFEGYENPFYQSKSWYKYNDTYPTVNTTNALVGSDKALSGKVSGTVTFNTDPTYEADGQFIRAETNFATFTGNSALTKEVLGSANSSVDYMLKMRIKLPAGNGKYQFYLNLKQDGVAGFTTLKSSYGYTTDGSRVNFETSDLWCYIPAGFDGTIYFSLKNAMLDLSGTRGSYASKPEEMVDLTKEFQMQLYTYGVQWKNAEVIIDDIAYEYELDVDPNGDGELNVKDVVALKRHLLSTEVIDASVADINGDGEVDIRDLIAIKNMLADL